MQTAGISAGEWGSLTNNFSTEYRYDYNGNILSLQRLNANAVLMHRINYTYNAKKNRLQAITATGINSSNYSYDAIGNLANDSGENVGVTWNAMNKVKTVVTPNSTLHFAYSPTGQRQIKKTGDKTEYYLHDATGNTMCVYELSGTSLTVKERTMYGSKRIGVYRQRIRFGYSGIVGGVVIAPGSGLVNVLHPQPVIGPDGRHYLEGSNRLQVIGVARTTLSLNRYAYKKGTLELKGLSPLISTRPTFLDGNKTAGLRDYELTDHLSNVMAVISDRKLSVDTNNDNITDYYAPQVVSFTDYYPFGFPMAERSGNLAGYRFGFNGQEGDGEIYGEKTTYAFEYRMQDARLGRFWSVDPLAGDYPWYTSYQFSGNTPIMSIDFEGTQPKEVITNNYVTKPIIGFITGALDISQDIQIVTFWRMGRGVSVWEIQKPSAITWGKAVYYSPEWQANNLRKDIGPWVSLIGHEHTHRKQINEEYWIPFMISYYREYSKNKEAGMDDYDAYMNISYEKEGYKSETLIDNFFLNSTNLNDFNAILLDEQMTEKEKSLRLQIMGIERVAIPQLTEQITKLKNFKYKLHDDILIKLFYDEREKNLKNQLQRKQNQVNKLKKTLNESSN